METAPTAAPEVVVIVADIPEARAARIVEEVVPAPITVIEPTVIIVVEPIIPDRLNADANRDRSWPRAIGGNARRQKTDKRQNQKRFHQSDSPFVYNHY
jgi:hypothetical protein